MSAPDRPPCLVVPAPDADRELLADRLWLLGARAVEERDGELVAGFSDHRAAVAAREALGEAMTARLVEVDDAEWETAWRRWARVVRVGHVVVRPVWVPLGPVGEDEVVVELEPQGAFGDGAHPSTRLALAAMLARLRPGATVLDVGCGSGVLSVAAALLGADVTAVDVDAGAVRVTADNARRNGVEDRVVPSTTPLARIPTSHDLVVANLGGSRVIVELAADLARVTAPGGLLVVAGLLEGLDQPAVDALTIAGMCEVGRDREDGWVAVTVAPRSPA